MFGFEDEIELLVPITEKDVLLQQELVRKVKDTHETEPEFSVPQQRLVIPADILQ